MTYIDDDSIVKCNLDALYSGELLIEGNTEAAEIIDRGEGYLASVPLAPLVEKFGITSSSPQPPTIRRFDW